jgi:hypothetical protein
MRSERESERNGEDDGDGARDEAEGERQKKKRVGNCATILEGNSGDRKLCLILVLCKNLESFFSSADSDSWNENRAKACCAAGLQTPEVFTRMQKTRGGRVSETVSK